MSKTKTPVETKSFLLKADGTKTEVTPINGKYFTLEEQQEYAGGYVEYVYLDKTQKGRILIVDEDGLSKGRPVNEDNSSYSVTTSATKS